MTPHEAIAEIRLVFSEAEGGSYNKAAMDRVAACCDALLDHKAATPQSVDQIQVWASEFFSGSVHSADKFVEIALSVSMACRKIESLLPVEAN